MEYVCRDCGFRLRPEKPTNKCPKCGSIYLLPHGLKVARRRKTITVKLSERFLSLVVGAVCGLLTFFIWGVALLIHGGAYAGPSAAKAAAVAFYLGIKLSLVLAICIGLAGFFLGQERLARLLGIIWGTDRAFNERLGQRLDSLVYSIPLWLVYLVLLVVIVGSYGYLAGRF